MVPALNDQSKLESVLDDGMDTGSTIVVEDLFLPFWYESVRQNDETSMESCRSFIEWLSDYVDDEYAGTVLVISIFEAIHYGPNRVAIENALGPKAKTIYSSIVWPS